jgi:hypothetical protein
MVDNVPRGADTPTEGADNVPRGADTRTDGADNVPRLEGTSTSTAGRLPRLAGYRAPSKSALPDMENNPPGRNHNLRQRARHPRRREDLPQPFHAPREHNLHGAHTQEHCPCGGVHRPGEVLYTAPVRPSLLDALTKTLQRLGWLAALFLQDIARGTDALASPRRGSSRGSIRATEGWGLVRILPRLLALHAAPTPTLAGELGA